MTAHIPENEVGRALREVWRPVLGFERLYEVSDFGNVRSLRSGNLLKGCKLNGYRRVLLCRDGRKTHAAVHRLVCIAFHGEQPDGHEVGHLDGTRDNNIATNLKWVTRSENMLHASAHGTLFQPNPSLSDYLRGDQHPQAKFGHECRARVGELSKSGESARGIARLTGVSATHVRRILKEVCNG